MGQIRPISIGVVWTKQGPKLKAPRRANFGTVGTQKAAFTAAGKGLRTRSFDGQRVRFKNS